MQRIILFLFLTATVLFADTALQFKAGWQLVGTPLSIGDLSVFDKKAKILWAYDAGSQQWKGYSPDGEVRDKLDAAGIAPLSRLDAFDAFWINSESAWTLTFKNSETANVPGHGARLKLAEGWNLVSLPDASIIDSALFAGMKLWKYRETEWQSNLGDVPFPDVKTVAAGEGFWLYSDENRTIDISKAASALHTFDSIEAMKAFIREMVFQNRHGYYDGLPVRPLLKNDDFSGTTPETAADDGASDATTTNVQEAGIDESDILKHDGKTIFFYDRHSKRIRVYDFASIVSGDIKEKSGIDLGGELQAMYLDGDRLVTVTQEIRYYILDTAVSEGSGAAQIMPPQPMEPPHFTVTFYDVSDPADIRELSRTVIDGTYMESRRKSDTLYLISSFPPQIIYDYPVIHPDTNCSAIYRALGGAPSYTGGVVCSSDGECVKYPDNETRLDRLYRENGCYRYSYDNNGTAWQYDYEHPVIRSENLVPRYTQGSEEHDYVTPKRLYAPYKLDQEYSITSIGAFDMRTGAMKQQVAYIGQAWTQYASANALYLGATSYPLYYDYIRYSERTALYKFALDDNLSYRARGFVEGRVLSQYSLSEYNGTLRVAATTGFSWRSDDTDNRVYTLRENGSEGLDIAGSVRGLGEPGEQIRAVRFAGDKAFVVTFRQTDPFYTLDLSDPNAPKVVGELKINGFSEYLHPVDKNRILSIGRDADANGRQLGLQVQLFDLSDFAHPVLADKITFGDRHTYSEAEHNPRAFAYRGSDGLFGFPFHSFSNGIAPRVGFDIYRLEGLKLSHRILLDGNADGWYSDEGRGIIFDFGGQTYGALFKGSHVLVSPIPGE